MTIGSPPFIAFTFGTVRRFIGAGTGLARLVEVSSEWVTDMKALYPRRSPFARKPLLVGPAPPGPAERAANFISKPQRFCCRAPSNALGRRLFN
jgi:hypothetical protein